MEKILRLLKLGVTAAFGAALAFGVAGSPATAAPYRTLLRAPDARMAAEVPNHLRFSRYLGSVPVNQSINLNVHLAYPHPEAVRQFDDMVNDPRSPMYGHFLTPKQFVNAFAPSLGEYVLVEHELERNGLHVWRSWSNRKLINVTTTAGALQTYFRTRLGRVRFEGREHFANLTPALMPDALRGRVMAVTGFDNFEWKSHLVKRNVLVPIPTPVIPVPAPIVPPGVAPIDMQTSYDYPIHNDPTDTGTGVTIAIEAAYGFAPTDINYFWSAFNVARTGTLVTIDPDGNVPPPIHPTDSAEVTIDVEQSTSNAPGANEKVYTAPYPLTILLEDTYNDTVSDPQVDVVSTSFGSCESNTSLSADAADNDTFEQGSIEGQTMFAAAGDDGSSDCRANGPDSVDFPASSIEVGSAGGTTLNETSAKTIASESGWSCSDAACDNGAGGGGVSALFGIPPWQVGLTNVSYPGSKVSTTMRNVPDVSLNADLNTSYAVFFVGTADLGYGGTSLVGPNLAAIWAQFEQKTGHRMGRSSNALYYAFQHGNAYGSGAFHDITTGFNFDSEYTGGTGFHAGTGYDVDTGWGSLDATKLMQSLPVISGPSNL